MKEKKHNEKRETTVNAIDLNSVGSDDSDLSIEITKEEEELIDNISWDTESDDSDIELDGQAMAMCSDKRVGQL